MNGALKPKGERAWVLKAWDITNNRQEILAIRFSTVQTSQQFAFQYNTLFPPQHQVPTFPAMVPQQGILFFLQLHVSKCDFAHIGQSNGPWECAVCTYSNDENVLICLMCGLSLDGSSSLKARNNNADNVQSVEEEKPWACISCTFVNTATALACGVCGAKKSLIPHSANAPRQPPQIQPLIPPQNMSPQLNTNPMPMANCSPLHRTIAINLMHHGFVQCVLWRMQRN